MRDNMKRKLLKVMSVIVCLFMLSVCVNNVDAASTRYYSVLNQGVKTFKKSGRKLTVKTKKYYKIAYYKTINMAKVKYVGYSKKFKLSKKCKYYWAAIAGYNRLYDKKYMKKTTFSNIKSAIIKARQYDSWEFRIVFVVKNGVVTKVLAVSA